MSKQEELFLDYSINFNNLQDFCQFHHLTEQEAKKIIERGKKENVERIREKIRGVK